MSTTIGSDGKSRSSSADSTDYTAWEEAQRLTWETNADNVREVHIGMLNNSSAENSVSNRSNRNKKKEGGEDYFMKTQIVWMYAVNMLFGYLIMLVTMTFAIELFLWVIIGLAIGHFIFNAKWPVADSVTACCAGRNQDDTGVNQAMTVDNIREWGLTGSGVEGGDCDCGPSNGTIGVGDIHEGYLRFTSPADDKNTTQQQLLQKAMTGANVIRVKITHMTCHNCENTVFNALSALDCVARVIAVSHTEKLGIVEMKWNMNSYKEKDLIVETIQDLGYDAALSLNENA